MEAKQKRTPTSSSMLCVLGPVLWLAVLAVAKQPSYLWNVGGAAVAPPFNISSVVPGIANDGEVVLFTTYFGAYTALTRKIHAPPIL